MQRCGGKLPWDAPALAERKSVVRLPATSARPAARTVASRVAPMPHTDGADERTRLWHVTLTLAGEPAPPGDLRLALERLARDHPFLLSGRYAADHAEIRYWEEARDLQDAAALAMRLWGEHRRSAGLPPWELIGLEIVDQPTHRRRAALGGAALSAVRHGVHPF